MATLGAVDLGDNVVWIDRRKSSRLRQVITELLPDDTGQQALLIESSVVSGGRPITLDLVEQPGSVIDALQSLADVPRDDNNALTLVLPEGSFQVLFLGENPITAEPVFPTAYPGVETPYLATVRIIEI